MPTAPKRFKPSNQPTKQQQAKQYDHHRGTAHERGYGARWREYSKWFLLQVECLLEGCAMCGRQADRTDHIEPCEPTDARFMDTHNHQPACRSCNDKKGKTLDVAVRSATLTPKQRAELDQMLSKAAIRAVKIEARMVGH